MHTSSQFFPFSSTLQHLSYFLHYFTSFLFLPCVLNLQMFKLHLYLKSNLYFLFSLICQPFPTFKVTLCCLFVLLSAIFPFIAQHWAMWKTTFVFFCDLCIFVSHFSQFLLHFVNLNHSLRIVLVNIFTHVKICYCFSRLFLNLWNENQSMHMVLFFIYDLPIFFYYVFLFCSNTCLQTFLHSLLYSNFPHFPHSLNHVCYPKTHSLLTRTQPWEGKLEYRCKSCKVMVCWRLHKTKNSIFHGNCSSRQRSTFLKL